MLKNILSLSGAQILSKNEQKSINGGWACRVCPPNLHCCPNGTCIDRMSIC